MHRTINSYLIKSTLLVLIVITLYSCKEELPIVSTKGNIDIRINQIGYYPKAVKKAIVTAATDEANFTLIELSNKEVVFSGQLSPVMSWDLANEKVRIADFTDFNTPGRYVVYIPEVGFSYPFEISSDILHAALIGSIKGLYYQRVGTALEEKYAGKWHREAGHPDDSILFHPSSGHDSGHTSSPKGWYDAGDYNKYVVNGSFPLGQLLMFQEQYPEFAGSLKTNIPDHNSALSDYLEELKYEMDWLLTMQDSDGGLFHKLTTKSFEGMIMPNAAVNQRYMVGKSTSATLDFAGCASQAYRIFKDLDPDYAEKCIEASRRAWQWAIKNPEAAFENPEDVSTGPYDDKNFKDEWYWAACELYLSTKEGQYLEHVSENTPDYNFLPAESWTTCMRYTGMISLLNHKQDVPKNIINDIEVNLKLAADQLLNKTQGNDYFQPIEKFVWGSNSDIANAAIVMAQAYKISGEEKYLHAIQESVDYIFGKNATGYSFLTGFGSRPPMFIHHRQSAADGIDSPVPGLLSGGPNMDQQDASNGVTYPDNAAPMQSWADQEPSYASNEICLNWNAPLTYILGFLEAEAKQGEQ